MVTCPASVKRSPKSAAPVSDAAGRSSPRPAPAPPPPAPPRTRAATRSAHATRSGAGVNAVLASAICAGWMHSLPLNPSWAASVRFPREPVGRLSDRARGCPARAPQLGRRRSAWRRGRQRRGWCSGRCGVRGAMPRSADRSSAPKHSASSRGRAAGVVHAPQRQRRFGHQRQNADAADGQRRLRFRALPGGDPARPGRADRCTWAAAPHPAGPAPPRPGPPGTTACHAGSPAPPPGAVAGSSAATIARAASLRAGATESSRSRMTPSASDASAFSHLRAESPGANRRERSLMLKTIRAPFASSTSWNNLARGTVICKSRRQ